MNLDAVVETLADRIRNLAPQDAVAATRETLPPMLRLGPDPVRRLLGALSRRCLAEACVVVAYAALDETVTDAVLAADLLCYALLIDRLDPPERLLLAHLWSHFPVPPSDSVAVSLYGELARAAVQNPALIDAAVRLRVRGLIT